MRKNVLIQAAALSLSGYGSYGRDITLALHNSGKFNVGLQSLQWANASFITKEDEEYKTLRKLVDVGEQMMEAEKEGWKPDIFIHCTVPHEWENTSRGHVNIGATAGVEVDRISVDWIKKINEMDLVFTISDFSKSVIVNTKYDVKEKDSENLLESIKVEKPIEAIPISVNIDNYNHKIEPLDYDFETKRNLTFMGQWGPGFIGEDRKNIGKLVALFSKKFDKNHPAHKEVGLVLKIHERNFSLIDQERMRGRIREIREHLGFDVEYPRIYVIGGSMSEQEMAGLYNHKSIEAFINLTHGEGQGMPIMEAAACNLPVMATAWSGHMHFLDTDCFIPIKYRIDTIPDAVVWPNVLEKDSKWSDPDDHHIMKELERWYRRTGWKKLRKKAEDQGERIREEYSRQATIDKYIKTLEKYEMM